MDGRAGWGQGESDGTCSDSLSRSKSLAGPSWNPTFYTSVSSAQNGKDGYSVPLELL